jgi:hypothetical protein
MSEARTPSGETAKARALAVVRAFIEQKVRPSLSLARARTALPCGIVGYEMAGWCEWCVGERGGRCVWRQGDGGVGGGGGWGGGQGELRGVDPNRARRAARFSFGRGPLAHEPLPLSTAPSSLLNRQIL